jgi:SAM-dependent methyltransferase
MTGVAVTDNDIERFIARWQGLEGGRERSNSQMFLRELTLALGLDPPAPGDSRNRDYIFERTVTFHAPDGTDSTGFIDLYKKGCFVLESKQSRQKDGKKAVPGQSDLFKAEDDTANLGRRTADRAWDVLMLNARRQAEDYAKALEASEGWPPFLIVCDVGHCFEVYADFTGQGKNYQQFPDRNGFRIYLEELRDGKVVKRLHAIWTDPRSLDPASQSAKVTREIAGRLAAVSKALEERQHDAEDVALFLMRCLFTMFAEDVKLLPDGCFKRWLEAARTNNARFKHELAQLWQAMDKGGYATIAETPVKRFNGRFFQNASVLDLKREEIGELLAAAKYNWKEVDPAIFGALLEQALKERERAQLGAHYTPRAYVERLVVVTIMEPLRQEWARVQATAERLKEEKRAKEAKAAVQAFHDKLCATRVLDPACGTGNFLYVALELMKRLEGEVLEALVDLGGQEALKGLEGHNVDPHQFLGLEKNPRAAAIAELVIWLGYLQWHYRTKGGDPSEPILRDFRNIMVMDAVLTWDGYPVPGTEVKDGRRVETYPNARRPNWPEAEFIVGNPPFIGGKDIREQLGDEYTETLWHVHSHINDSADLVMYWWDRAAEIVATPKSPTRRFGLVSTNSITQLFSRRVVARHLEAKRPISLLMAIPDHPWTKASEDHAAVRIAMTVGCAGRHEGVLREVTREAKLDTDQPEIELNAETGRINADLTVGIDVGATEPLLSNEGLCSRGMSLHGAGFIVTPSEAAHLGLGRWPALERHIRHYRNGRDLNSTPRGVMVIDLFGLEADEVRKRFPEVYQHVLQEVRDKINDKGEKIGRAWNRRDSYRENWWIFGEPRTELRPALHGLPRYIATVETATHRIFQFVDASILPDNMLVCMGLDDAFYLGVLSSRLHVIWALRAGGWLGVGNDPRYSKSRCFDPFPFPVCSDALKAEIRAVAEELDAHRKARQAEHPRLTLTQMYNVLEKLRAPPPAPPSPRLRGEGIGSAAASRSRATHADARGGGHQGQGPRADPEGAARQARCARLRGLRLAGGSRRRADPGAAGRPQRGAHRGGEDRHHPLAAPRLPDPPLRLRRRARPPRRGEAPGAPDRARHPGRARPRRRPAGDEAPLPHRQRAGGDRRRHAHARIRRRAAVGHRYRARVHSGQGHREARRADGLRPRPPRPSRLDRQSQDLRPAACAVAARAGSPPDVAHGRSAQCR